MWMVFYHVVSEVLFTASSDVVYIVLSSVQCLCWFEASVTGLSLLIGTSQYIDGQCEIVVEPFSTAFVSVMIVKLLFNYADPITEIEKKWNNIIWYFTFLISPNDKYKHYQILQYVVFLWGSSNVLQMSDCSINVLCKSMYIMF